MSTIINFNFLNFFQLKASTQYTTDNHLNAGHSGSSRDRVIEVSEYWVFSGGDPSHIQETSRSFNRYINKGIPDGWRSYDRKGRSVRYPRHQKGMYVDAFA